MDAGADHQVAAGPLDRAMHAEQIARRRRPVALQVAHQLAVFDPRLALGLGRGSDLVDGERQLFVLVENEAEVLDVVAPALQLGGELGGVQVRTGPRRDGQIPMDHGDSHGGRGKSSRKTGGRQVFLSYHRPRGGQPRPVADGIRLQS